MLDWGPIAEIIDKQAVQFLGRDAVYLVRNFSGPDYDRTEAAPTEVPVKIIGSKRSVKFRQDTVVAVGDRVFAVAPPATGEALEIGNRIRDNGVEFTIKDIERIEPGDTLLLYEVLAGR